MSRERDKINFQGKNLSEDIPGQDGQRNASCTMHLMRVLWYTIGEQVGAERVLLPSTRFFPAPFTHQFTTPKMPPSQGFLKFTPFSCRLADVLEHDKLAFLMPLALRVLILAGMTWLSR
jgi:hypothetical protein